MDTLTLVTPGGKEINFTIRFGGASVGSQGADDPLLWLHCSQTLRKLGIGKPLNSVNGSKTYLCTTDEVAEAIDLSLALPREFLLIQGFVVWEKFDDNAGGISSQILAGRLEKIASDNVDKVWALLQSQERLSNNTLHYNVQASMAAWTLAGLRTGLPHHPEPIDTTLIPGYNVTVDELADGALGVWLTIFILGDAEYAPSTYP
jgi:hypothetical protein